MKNEHELLQDLKKSLENFDRQRCEALAQEAIEQGLDPVKAIDVLKDTVELIGHRFSSGEIFLPELVGAGNAMEGAMNILNAEILKRGAKQKSLGVVVIGTVFGDLHTIGKGMVGTLLTAAGFAVHDIGINIPAKRFISEIQSYNADILAMSALLSTTAREQKTVIVALEEAGLREKIKVMVGGGAVTNQFAESIGADGYAPSAPLAVNLAKKLLVS
jgi:corrinoid protein of di/trimethylamine methyltransferase